MMDRLCCSPMLIGPFLQSKLLFVTALQVFFQKNFSAISLQNLSGSLMLREYISLYCSIDLCVHQIKVITVA